MPASPDHSPPGSLRLRGTAAWFWSLLAGTLAIKVALAAALPVLGDEAYVFLWGRNPALGYYDHPPLSGWMVHLLLGIGDSLPLLRLPSILLAALIALGMVWLLRPYGAAEAYLGASLFLLTPVNVLGVLTLTDTPLILFSFLSGAALIHARRRGDHLGWYTVSGVFLGLAFLSKYLAVLLALGYAVWLVASLGQSSRPARRRMLAGFALLVAGSVPFVAFNLWWNAGHCWVNVIFNFYSRHVGEEKNYSVPRNLLFYVTTPLYLATPPVLVYLARRRRQLREVLADPVLRPAAFLFAVPMAAFLGMALVAVFGAYWVLAFYPFLFLLVPRVLDRRQLVSACRFMAVFTAVQLVLVAGVLAQPLERLERLGFYQSLVTMERTSELLARIEPYRRGAHLAAPGYTLASILSFRLGETVSVFGEGSHYAREDDFLTDWRTLDGRAVLVVSKSPFELERYRPYFRSVETAALELHGTTIHLLRGEGFDYRAYRAGVLRPILERYYRIPAWLPTTGCTFCARYFPGPACPGSSRRVTK